MYTLVIAEFKHETNTFSSQLTDMQSFARRRYLIGEAMISALSGTRTETGGFLDVLQKEPDIRIVPAVAADAIPAGRVTQHVFDNVLRETLLTIERLNRVDGILLSLHGAMVTEESDDGEGDFLEVLRDTLGAEVPIIATLDLHSNITDKMQKNADVLINFDYYPHKDMYERGKEAALLMVGTLRKSIKPVMKCRKLRLILPTLSTDENPMGRYVEMAHEYEKRPSVLTVSVSHGFPCSDIYELGMTAVAVTDAAPETAGKIAAEIAEQLWQDRYLMKQKTYTPNEAVRVAMKSPEHPVILADLTDNPGGGSACDGTHILRAMLEQKAVNAAAALIYDPESVAAAEKAGEGNYADLQLGGKALPELLGAPLECRALVKLISPGKYINRGPMDGGLAVDLKKSAVVDIHGIEVIVASNITQPYDTEIFYSHGIDPAKKDILLLKSTHHFRAAYASIAKKILKVEAPGLLSQDPSKINYKKCRRPIFPLDKGMDKGDYTVDSNEGQS